MTRACMRREVNMPGIFPGYLVRGYSGSSLSQSSQRPTPVEASPMNAQGVRSPMIATACFVLSFACAPQPRPAPAGQQAAGTGAWWRDAVCYEVFVRSFADANGDGIGDLKGLTGRLDYVNDGNPGTTTD